MYEFEFDLTLLHPAQVSEKQFYSVVKSGLFAHTDLRWY